MGLLTVVLFGFFGLMWRVDRPVLGWVLLALCVFRGVLWIRELRWFLGRSRGEEEEGG